MTIRLYFDEDSMRQALVQALRKRGVDVLTALEAETVEATDQQQLEYAVTQQRVLYSFNVADFCQLHAEWLIQQRSHCGIILCHQKQFSVGEQMRRLMRLIAAVPAEEMFDRLEFLGEWG